MQKQSPTMITSTSSATHNNLDVVSHHLQKLKTLFLYWAGRHALPQKIIYPKIKTSSHIEVFTITALTKLNIGK